nr:MAG TPA_asm: Protein of unknown function (DUF1351) [Caudoviricetes sp.]
MTAPKTCENCGAALDAGERCDCREAAQDSGLIRLIQLPVIEERLRDLKEATEHRVAEAMSLVVSDETLTAVKNVRAELNRDFTEFENQRKAVKAAIMAPYDSFEAVYRECVTDPFKRADADLKGKIDATEREIKGCCEKQLEAYFQELCAVNHVDFLTFAQTGVKVDMASARAKTPKKLMDRLRVIVEGCAQAMATIDGMEHGDEIAVEYKKCLDLTFAIRLVTERHQKLEAERQRKAEAEAACIRVAPGPEPAEVTPVPKRVQKAAVERLTCTFTVTDTRERLKLLKNFLDSNGYQYK